MALSSNSSPTVTFTAPNVSTVLTFSLTVTDAQGLADPTPDTVVITVTALPVINTAPVADAGVDQSVLVSQMVTLTGQGSDADNNLPLSFGWTQTGGPAVTLSSSNIPTVTFTAPVSPTVLTFTLSVTDALGLADATPDVVVVTVSLPPSHKTYVPLLLN